MKVVETSLVAETSLRVLGLEHPSALTNISGLAYMRTSQGRVVEAIAIPTQAANPRTVDGLECYGYSTQIEVRRTKTMSDSLCRQ